jgi:hypothetical protein
MPTYVVVFTAMAKTSPSATLSAWLLDKYLKIANMYQVQIVYLASRSRTLPIYGRL